MQKRLRIYVAGHRGMVGSAILRRLQATSHAEIVTRTHQELDLTDQHAVRQFFSSESIDQVYLAAAKVGSIHANNVFPGQFLYENLMIQSNIINEAYRAGVNQLLFLGSSCIYPKFSAQPIREEYLLSGLLEPTNEPYAIAKIAGLKLCESYNRQYGTDYRSVMPTNLYGPGDNYHAENSHVVPALIRRFHEAKHNQSSSVVIWGTGKPRREFLYVDDLAEACVKVMSLDRSTLREHSPITNSHINVGWGADLCIAELANLIAEIVGYHGEIAYDNTKPDGTPQKLLDISLSRKIGIDPSVDIRDGLRLAYADFLNRYHVGFEIN